MCFLHICILTSSGKMQSKTTQERKYRHFCVVSFVCSLSEAYGTATHILPCDQMSHFTTFLQYYVINIAVNVILIIIVLFLEILK